MHLEVPMIVELGKEDNRVEGCVDSDPCHMGDTAGSSDWLMVVSLERERQGQDGWKPEWDHLPMELANDRFEYTETVESRRSF